MWRKKRTLMQPVWKVDSPYRKTNTVIFIDGDTHITIIAQSGDSIKNVYFFYSDTPQVQYLLCWICRMRSVLRIVSG